MGTKGSKSSFTINHPHLSFPFKGAAKPNSGVVSLEELTQELKDINLSGGELLTLRNVCRLFEKYHRKEKAEKRKLKGGTGIKKDATPQEPSDTDLCLKYIERYFADLIRSPKGRKSLLLLSREPLIRVLQSDRLHLRAEYELLLYAAAWSNFQVEKSIDPTSHDKDEVQVLKTSGKEVKTEDSQPNAGSTNNNVSVDNKAPENSGTADLTATLTDTPAMTSSPSEPKKAEEASLDDDEDMGPKINLRESAALFSHLSQGALSQISQILFDDGSTVVQPDSPTGSQGTTDNGSPKGADNEQEKKKAEEEEKKKKEEEEKKKKQQEDDDLEDKEGDDEQTKERKRLERIRKRLENTEWEAEGGDGNKVVKEDNSNNNDKDKGKDKEQQDPKDKPDDNNKNNNTTTDNNKESKEKDDEELLREQELAGDHTNVNLRGTAGLYHQMGQGITKLNQSTGSTAPTKDKGKEKVDPDAPNAGETEEETKLIKLVHALKFSDQSDDKGWEPQDLALPSTKDETQKKRKKKVTIASDSSTSSSTSTTTSITTVTNTNTFAPAPTAPPPPPVKTIVTSPTAEEEEEEDEVELPYEKTTNDYIAKLKTHLDPLLPYIRFSNMSTYQLSLLEEEDFVPKDIIEESYRYRFYKLVAAELQGVDPVYKLNTRPRRYSFVPFIWDVNKKDSRVQVSADGRTVQANPGSGCAHKSILATEGFSYGVHTWEIKLNQYADCYSAAGVVGPTFNVTNDQMGISTSSQSWALGLYPGTHCTASPRRVQTKKGRLNSGSVVKLVLDMDAGKLDIYVDKALEVTYNGITAPAYPAMTLCELTSGGYTLTVIDEMSL